MILIDQRTMIVCTEHKSCSIIIYAVFSSPFRKTADRQVTEPRAGRRTRVLFIKFAFHFKNKSLVTLIALKQNRLHNTKHEKKN